MRQREERKRKGEKREYRQRETRRQPGVTDRASPPSRRGDGGETREKEGREGRRLKEEGKVRSKREKES